MTRKDYEIELKAVATDEQNDIVRCIHNDDLVRDLEIPQAYSGVEFKEIYFNSSIGLEMLEGKYLVEVRDGVSRENRRDRRRNRL